MTSSGHAQSTHPIWRLWSSVQDIFVLLLMLVLIMLVMGRGSDLFLTSRNITNLLMDSTTVGIIAVFMTMLIISGGLDLSVASTTALCGVIIGVMQESGLWQGVGIALLVGALIGFINGFLVTYLEINPLITTLGMLSVTRGMAFVLSDGLTIPVIDMTGEQTAAYNTFTQLSEGKVGTIPIPILFVVGLFIISMIVLRYTTYGRAVYVIGDNEKAAYLAGLPVKRYRMMTYILCGLSAAAASVFLTARLYAADPRAAPNIELTVITAVVLGGTSLVGGQGRLMGTLLGVLILSGLLNGLKLQSVSTEMQNIAQGVVLLLAVGIDQVRQGKIQLRIPSYLRPIKRSA